MRTLLNEQSVLLPGHAENHAMVIINETNDRETSHGDLRFSDIINYVRDYLTDNDLIHYNQLSHAFAGRYDIKGVYIKNQIEASQLSRGRQLKIYQRFCNLYGNQTILPITSTRGLYSLLYQYKEQNPYAIFEESMERIDGSAQHFLEQMINPQQSNNDLRKNYAFANQMILAGIKPSETQYLIKHFWKLILFFENPKINDLWKMLIGWPLKALPFILIAVIGTIVVDRETPPPTPGIADIHITKTDIYTNNIVQIIAPCNKALNNSDIGAFGNFSHLMQLMNFSTNLTQAALFSCMTWISNCTSSSTFERQHHNITQDLQVGCDYDYTAFLNHQAQASLKKFYFEIIGIICGLFSPLIYEILGVALMPCYLPALQFTGINRNYTAAKELALIAPEDFIEEKKATQITTYHTSFFKNIQHFLQEQARKKSTTPSPV